MVIDLRNTKPASEEKVKKVENLLGQIGILRGQLTALIQYIQFLREAIEIEAVTGPANPAAHDRFENLLFFYQSAYNLITFQGKCIFSGIKYNRSLEISARRLQEVDATLREIRLNPYFSNVEFPSGSYDFEPILAESVY